MTASSDSEKRNPPESPAEKERVMSLLSAMANRKSATHRAALKRYAAILGKNDDADADELTGVMETLGKTETDVVADLGILASWKNHESRYARSAHATNVCRQARAELEKYQADLATFKAGGGYDPLREIGVEKFQLRFNQAECDLCFATGALGHMKSMKAAHPELLGGMPLPK